MRHAQRARDVLREIPIAELLQMMKKAGRTVHARPSCRCGDGTQTPDQFARMQSATTGLPEHMCRFNMEKNHFVLNQMDKILDSPDARPGPEHPVARLRHRVTRRAGQLSGAIAGAGHGAAEQLARRAHPLAADHPDADRPGAQARPAGAVDAVPHGPGLRPGRRARSRPSPSIPASATSAPPCWPAVRAA